MSGDYSRLTDRTRKRFAALLMQQGRVHLDSDWNELVDELTRRARMQSLDTFGKAAVPSTTPDGFKLTIPPGPPSPLDVAIGAGRCYVGGLLAEAFPGEQVGGLPLSYLHQPYLPSPPPLPAVSASGLFYLDVWLREVTWLEDPDLLEVALGGIDTTTRLQTVWQVKFLAASGDSSPDCTTDLDAKFPPSAGRLSTQAVKPPAPDDPCLLPESGGFRGVENRLYRIEIHDGGPAGAATFKWSRENASVATVVQKIQTIAGRSTITVERIGRDPVLRFQKDDWIEVQDDARELAAPAQAGVMAQVMAVSEADRTLALDRLLPASFDATDPTRHTRVRRWDQRDDVDPTTGTIPVSSAIGKWFPLEDGVQVQLSLDPTAAVKEFHVADTWSFAARTADASVEPLHEAPPRAIEHRYAPLATLLPGPALSDCRTLWPPPAGCECVCVTAESHASGAFTLQAAVNKVIAAGGGKVCVGPGIFNIKTPVVIQGPTSVTMSGTGSSSVISYAGAGGAIEVSNAGEVTIEHLGILNDARSIGPNTAGIVNGISVVHAMQLRVERCVMVVIPPNRDTEQPPRGDGAAVLLRGMVNDCAICDNILFAVAGVASAAGEAALMLGRVRIEHNLIEGSDGILLDGNTIYNNDMAIRDNLIAVTRNAGITLLGAQLLSANGATGACTVSSNDLRVLTGRAIVTGLHNVTIQDNHVLGPLTFGRSSTQPGIALVRNALTPVIDHCIIAQNRVLGVGGSAIEIDTDILDLVVRDNIVDGAASGVVMTDEANAQVIAVEGNQIANIQVPAGGEAFGIRLSGVQKCADVSDNLVRQVAAGINGSAAGILFVNCMTSRARGNVIESVVVTAPPPIVVGTATREATPVALPGADVRAAANGPPPLWASLAALPALGDVDFVDNLIRQVPPVGEPGSAAISRWRGIWVLTAIGGFVSVPRINLVTVANTPLVVFGNGDVLAVTLPTERATVRDNTVSTGENVLPLIEVNVQTDITFTGNRVLMSLGARETWAVKLTSSTLIVSNNRVNCGNLVNGIGSLGDLDLSAAVVVQPPTGAAVPLATVLGNMVHRAIHLNSVPLANPWLPFNILIA